MDSIVGSLRLGWEALLLKDDAYERMRTVADPVVKGLILIVIVGLAVGLLGFVGDVMEWATTPNLARIKDTVFAYLTQMPWWQEAAQNPEFVRIFQWWYDLGWNTASVFGTTSVGAAAAGIVLIPLGLIFRWLLYGLVAYLFARWMGGTANLGETLGVLALAVAPQALNVLSVFPFVELGGLVAVWGLLCAYLGIKTAHNLSWYRSLWVTLLPFMLAALLLALGACLGSTIFAVLVRGG
jgi:hypothetical protein